VLSHVLPLLALWFEFLTTDISFRPRSLIPVLIVTLLYLLVNLGYTLANKPVYSVLTFRDGISYAYVAGAVILIILHFGIAYLFRCCKK
jgi:hypothetical protein